MTWRNASRSRSILIVALVLTYADLVASAAYSQPTAAVTRGNSNFIRPQFSIKAVYLKAIDETGIDALGSDEIVARFMANDNSMLTGKYGSVDNGEIHFFRTPESCIYPAIDTDGARNQRWRCDQRGRPGPVTVTVDLYEYDGLIRAMLTDPILDFEICGASDVATGSSCSGIRNEITTIGRYRLTFTEAELVDAMPREGMRLTRTLRIDDCSGFVTFENGICVGSLPWEAAYDVKIEITRTKNGPGQPPVHQ